MSRTLTMEVAGQQSLSEVQRTVLMRWYNLARSFDPKLKAGHLLQEPTRALRYTRLALKGIRRYGSLLESVTGRKPRSPFRHYWRLHRRFGHTIEDYYRYRLHDASDDLDAAVFLSERRLLTINAGGYQRLGVNYDVLTDKVQFEKRCYEHGLAAIPTIATIERGCLEWGRAGGDGELPAVDLITKPINAKHGAGIRLWRWDREGYLDASGDRLAADALLTRLSEDSRRESLLIQPRIRNVEPLARLAKVGLCTARVITSHPIDGPSVVRNAVFKMPSGSRLADNFAEQGIAAPIDLDSGEIGRAVTKSVEAAVIGESFTVHPDTGEPIAGIGLPGWGIAKDLCVAAHERFRQFHSIGWDLAITDRGPVLVEGNEDPDPVLSQQPGLAPLGRTMLVDDMMTFLE